MLRALMVRRALALLFLASCAKPATSTGRCTGNEPTTLQLPFFGLGVEGHPVSLVFKETFCLEDPLPDSPPRFSVLGPDDVAEPFELRDAGFSNFGAEVTVAFTPSKVGSHYVRGELGGGQGVAQLFVPVARDRSRAVPVVLPLEAPNECSWAEPFGARGAVCGKYGAPLIVLEPSLPGGRAELPEVRGVAAHGDVLWTADFSRGSLDRYRLFDGGLGHEGALPVNGNGSVVDLGVSDDGRALLTVQRGGTTLVSASDGGLSSSVLVAEESFGACLSGDSLAFRGVKGARLQRLDGGAAHDAVGGSFFVGCTPSSLWFVAAGGGGIGAVGRTGARLDAQGLEQPLTSVAVGFSSFLSGPTHSVPFVVPMNDLTGLTEQGSIWGEVFVPAWTDAGLELEWYGEGRGLFASETQVLKAGDGGLFVYPRQ